MLYSIAHLFRPVFIVTKREEGPVIQQLCGLLVQIDITDVGKIIALAFQPVDSVSLNSQHLARTVIHCVRSVE